jgi:hypothetical protein
VTSEALALLITASISELMFRTSVMARENRPVAYCVMAKPGCVSKPPETNTKAFFPGSAVSVVTSEPMSFNNCRTSTRSCSA